MDETNFCCVLGTFNKITPIRIGVLSPVAETIWARVVASGQMLQFKEEHLCQGCVKMFYDKGSCFTHES